MKILLADDHPLFRDGMRYLLTRKQSEVIVLEAGDISTALALLTEHGDVDLILLDLKMPGMEDFKGYQVLEQQVPEIPIVILSASESPLDIQQALDAGAAGYIPKSFTTEAMQHALQLVLEGYVYQPPPDDTKQKLFNQLSARQVAVLRLLCEGLNNKAIARRLHISETTVKHHVAAIFRVLDVSNRTQVALKVKILLI
ncbi:response regulator transcription factor [Candidatus Venteria ishoeyi]|uniref:Transcriptional regulatory protein DegU n=1 Tax=Candidatus Venteria ishoeyi TaxID=1899563 RepID=A0A1H6F5X0_9GAMM|nr:response regulator transcription factor [Candidatus Venteria ishoeyi]MDM8546197.1 response regulator transcription factor [Candidatus Venteria ishoeyi]SEH04385.1 Transcriptional regulatory protein DegU [Candidatus Venteria ishoeyi]